MVVGSAAVAFFARLRGAAPSVLLALALALVLTRFAAGRVLAAAVFAGLAAARLLAAGFSAFVARGAALVARLAGLAGADPLVVFAAEAFLAGVLVAVRFTGFVAAGLAFVAATSPFRS